MKALSIRQPYAWLICAGYKDVENRYWPLYNLPQRIYVHAGAKVDDAGAIRLWDNKERLGIQGCLDTWIEICNTNLFSVWHEIGMYGFMLANPTLYDKPILYRGRVGLFRVEVKR